MVGYLGVEGLVVCVGKCGRVWPLPQPWSAKLHLVFELDAEFRPTKPHNDRVSGQKCHGPVQNLTASNGN